ncbi:hypothetical protein EV356DRAFT_531782 [Viridothelium virens]|uniref:Coupling of ubiquitin conjugation to ER degradation protein 1 n=1 Tax=Viridothelium virens TaxID=1048519 RepID=A0A6A6HDQ9_VIRVR|nr:hypothetical protein EV356DRAFT_531782 [Viridothelium virens]
MAEQTINIPQLLAVLLVGFLAVRWYFSSPDPNGGGSSRGSNTGRTRPVDPAQVEQVAQMFPQLSRRDIMWDLQRNGGSVQATTERVLGGRSLEVPPPSFQPRDLTSSAPTSSSPPSSTPRSLHPDLITRYNLASKISSQQTSGNSPASSSNATTSQGQGQGQGWSQNKNERQQLLQRRREEMILAARRKMEEKDKATGADEGN